MAALSTESKLEDENVDMDDRLHLLTIAPEIRLLIYEYLLVRPTPIPIRTKHIPASGDQATTIVSSGRQTSYYAPLQLLPFVPKLTTISRQVQAEARSLFFANVFLLSNDVFNPSVLAAFRQASRDEFTKLKFNIATRDGFQLRFSIASEGADGLTIKVGDTTTTVVKENTAPVVKQMVTRAAEKEAIQDAIKSYTSRLSWPANKCCCDVERIAERAVNDVVEGERPLAMFLASFCASFRNRAQNVGITSTVTRACYAFSEYGYGHNKCYRCGKNYNSAY